jgi:ribosomal protein S18 acetylase RimI-like enzyme
MDTLVIRRGSANDLARVARLAHDIWWQHYPGIITPGQIRYMLARGYSVEALTRFVTDADAGLALAEQDAELAGFAAWYVPDVPSTLKLDRLYVLPTHHRQGIGRRLIEHVAGLARAAGCTSLVLNVNRRNTGSIRAYEQCGFSIRESGDFAIDNGYVMEDYIMARTID